MLSDGSTVAIAKEPDAVRVRLVSRDGAVQHEIALPGMKRAFISAETADGKVVLAVSPLALSGRFTGFTTIIIDRARGVVERSVPKVRPDFLPLSGDPRSVPREAGKPLAVVDEKGQPMLLDLRSGQTKRL